MPGVKKVVRPLSPKFLAVNQFKLEWSHFTHSETKPIVNGTQVHATVAMTCEFDFVESGDVLVYLDQQKKWRLGKVTVKCLMDKSQSRAWAPQLRKNSPQQNTDLLKHERVHVELAERHARYVFQQIQQVSATGSDLGVVTQQLISAADRIRKDHWNKLAAMNAQYERETAHGTNASAQQRWNATYLSTQNTNAVL